MSFVKFPINVKPSRVTVNLQHQHEIFQSPVTGIQQVAARGGAYWRWTIEYKDISLEERDIVQSFLMSCRGSLNHFKVPDFSNYSINGVASDWADLFEGNGDFLNQEDEDYFVVTSITQMYAFRQVAGGLTFRKWDPINRIAVYKDGVNSLTSGATYLLRAQIIPDDHMSVSMAVGSLYDYGANGYVKSADVLSLPFTVNSTYIDHAVVVINANSGGIPFDVDISNFSLSRVGLICNSENLLTYSNIFDTGWTTTRCTVDSGGIYSPNGIQDGAWKWFGQNLTNTTYILTSASYTKNNTEDLYTGFIFAKADEKNGIAVQLNDGGASNLVSATFHLQSGTIVNGPTTTGTFKRGRAKITDIGSGWWKCAVSAVVNSVNVVKMRCDIASGTDTQFTNNGSSGIWIANAGMRMHPYAGHYVPTSDTTIVGSWQTGAQIYVEGLDVSTRIAAAGDRFELITRYHKDNNAYERSEFKRLTKDLVSNKEGWGIASFDPPIRNGPEYTRDTTSFSGYSGESHHPAIIFGQPKIKARLLGNTVQYIEKPLQMTDITFDIVEDLTE